MGRKPLLIIGSLGMAVGALGTAACDEFQIGGMVAVLCIIVYAASFMMSWGPICWVLIAEIFPNTIRSKAVAIAVAFQWVFNYLVSSTFPVMYEFSPFFAYSLYGVICLVAALFVWRCVPETKGRTLEEMNQLSLFDFIETETLIVQKPAQSRCKIKDWRSKVIVEYYSLVKGER